MATISTDTYLDGGTARTAGETWTINGCTLTIRTDTRWHANAPASMTGSLGTMTVSSALGGSIKVDGTKVRWIQYYSGTGTVPAIGTTVTQGGVSGYLLGVWADYVSAPTAPGATMPGTGWIKFREVTGGSFAAQTPFSSGISAITGSTDVVGWIEVALDSNSSFAGNELGAGVIFQGDWFDLGTTSGSRAQTFQVPTNGGGSGTHVFAVQIETAPGSGVYEWYPTANATLGGATWSATNIATDSRGKIVESTGNGQIRIGWDGTTNVGYCPPSGCKVRIPNIFGRTVATASRATNQVPGAVTRGNISGGNYTVNGLHADFQFATVSTTAVKTSLKNMVLEAVLSLSDSTSPVDIDNICIGGFTGGATKKMSLTRFTGGTVQNVKVVFSGNVTGGAGFDVSTNVAYSNIEVINFKARTGLTSSTSINNANNCTFTNLKTRGGGNISVNTCNNCTFTNTDHIDRLEGSTTTANSVSVISLTACNYITIDGITFGDGGQLSDTQCYSPLVAFATTASTNVKIRNIGTRTSPLNCGSSSTFYPQYIVNFIGTEAYIKIQRVFLTGVRTAAYGGTANNQVGMVFEDVIVDYAKNYPTPQGLNPIYRKMSGAEASVAPTSNLGNHWMDTFTADTTGVIRWNAAGPSTDTLPYNTLTATASQGTGYITSVAAISLDTIGDTVVSESQWQFKGHTGFQNLAPTIRGTSTSGVTIYYDLDTGSGYRGTWTQATGANLSAETVSPSGFKMKIKVQATSVNTSMSITGVSFFTTSTLTAQANNQYPLDTNTLAFTGLAVGSEVRCYVGTDPATATEIGGVESTAGSTFSFTHSSGGSTGYIMILAMGYQPIYIPYTYKSTDDTILIQPVIDRNYSNPA